MQITKYYIFKYALKDIIGKSNGTRYREFLIQNETISNLWNSRIFYFVPKVLLKCIT